MGVDQMKNKKSAKSHNKVAFYLIALAIPLFFFVAIELVLRVAGFGKSTPLFIENPAHPNYLLARPDVMQRYFPFAKNPPAVSMETDFFLAEKPTDGLRIFIQGGSTAAGFPYGLGASLSGTLEQRLRQSLPAHQVEVINTAMAAVNSHTLLDLADDIIAQDPDLVLIYAGHNEFLGIMGASSNYSTSSSFWLTRSMLWLKDMRLFQLFQWTLSQLQGASSDKQQNPARTTMMAKVAENQSIPLNSDVYNAGLYQFNTNMGDLLAKYQSAGIQVLISSIGSNHKDQAPLKSAEVEAKYAPLVKTISTKAANLKIEELGSISSTLVISQSALLHFELGKLFEQHGEDELAAKHYELAVAHDLLKFRAPQAVNDIIKALAQQYNAGYVDAHAYLQAQSPNKIIGNELMLEHLHPNLRGYYVISEAFYNAIAKGQYFSPWQNIPITKAWPERLVLPSEEYIGFANAMKLKSEYPFVSTNIPLTLPVPSDKAQELGLQHFNKRIDWLQMVEQNLAQYRKQNNSKMVMKCLQILADALPHNGLYAIQAAEQLEAIGENALARHYYRRALLAGAIDDALLSKAKKGSGSIIH